MSPRNTDEEVFQALKMIFSYGSIDGAHHKQWLLDQVVRILTGCSSVETEATDHTGATYTYSALGESDLYKQWIANHKDGEDGPETYEWDEGCPP